MRPRRARSLEVLSVSALDLFASALGIFMLIAILLFPYYLRQPALDAQEAGAQAQLRAAGAAADAARAGLRAAQAAKAAAAAVQAEAATARAAAEGEKAQAEAAHLKALARSADIPAPTPVPVPAPPPQQSRIPITDLDLVFVIDTTRSMAAPIDDLREDLKSIVRVLSALAPSLRAGVVAYRDRDRKSGYETQVFPPRTMTPAGLDAIQAFVDGLRAKGGDDWPEMVEVALAEAATFRWRPDAHLRVVLIGDAPPRRLQWDAAFAAIESLTTVPGAPGATRRVSVIYPPQSDAGLRRASPAKRRDHEISARFMALAADRGGGRFVEFAAGRMLEQVLLSVIEQGDFAGSRRAGRL